MADPKKPVPGPAKPPAAARPPAAPKAAKPPKPAKKAEPLGPYGAAEVKKVLTRNLMRGWVIGSLVVFTPLAGVKAWAAFQEAQDDRQGFPRP